MYVELKNIQKRFGDYQAADSVSFGVEKGKLIGLLGPSGSGKTTILRMIAGLEAPDSGDIYIDGQRVNDIPAGKRGIGFVFQNYALFRYSTVFDNIAFGLEVQKKKKAEIKERVDELIELVGLRGLEKRYPNQLSGGQRQRVAFARALAPNPHLLLLDEPFAAIDAKIRQELRSWLREMIDRLGITSIFVTHDQDEAVEVAHEIIITNAGRIEQMGSPVQIYKNPTTPFVAQFIGQSDRIPEYNRFKGFESGRQNDSAIVRPEFLQVTKNGEFQQYFSAAETGTVETISFRGSHTELKVRVKDSLLTATRSLEQSEIQEGEEVHVLIYRMYALKDGKVVMMDNNALLDSNPIYL